jgi:peptide/nickel transport system substrate-binding protein
MRRFAAAVTIGLVGILALSAPKPAGAQAKQIIISQPADAITMDPAKSTLTLNVTYFYNLFDTLTHWDASLKLQPALATTWKQVSDTVYEFRLRSGVTFHDGAPFGAEDVKATLDRLIVPGKTVVQSGFATISGVEILNPQTVRIVTKMPDPLLVSRLAQMGAQICPARLVRSDEGLAELARKPIGTGAYRFVEWTKDDKLVMEAYRGWWGWAGKTPAIDRVIWKPIPDEFARMSALQKGEVDIVTNVPPDQIKEIRERRNTQILSVPGTRTVAFWMNTNQPPLSDKRVRQALHYAMDLEGIVKGLFSGHGKPFSGVLADTDFGYNPTLKPYPYDVARAKRLLAEAGYPGGIDITLYAGYGTMVNDKQLLEVMADMWSHAGIRAKVQMMEMSQRQKMNNERSLPPNSALLITPQSTLLDADGSNWRMFHPNGFGGKYWAGNQPGQPFHDLMEQARVSLDPNKRKALYAETTRILHEEKPWLELFQEEVIYGAGRRVVFKPRPDYRLIVAEMTLEP